MSSETSPAELLQALLLVPLGPEDAEPNGGSLGEFEYNSYDDGHRLYFKVSEDFFEVDDDYQHYEAVEKEFRELFDAVVTQVARVWGAPTYRNDAIRCEGEDYDDAALHEQFYWQGGLACAIWRYGHWLAFVEVEHHDKELPIMLILGTHLATPHDSVYR